MDQRDVVDQAWCPGVRVQQRQVGCGGLHFCPCQLLELRPCDMLKCREDMAPSLRLDIWDEGQAVPDNFLSIKLELKSAHKLEGMWFVCKEKSAQWPRSL